MNDLDRANELREEINKIHKMDKYNQQDCFDMQQLLNEDILDMSLIIETRESLEQLRITRRQEHKKADNIRKEAKQLKEKVEKGCDKLFRGENCQVRCGWMNIVLCPNCQEALKILNEILGEKE